MLRAEFSSGDRARAGVRRGGAVMVLFLFVVMMLDNQFRQPCASNFRSYIPVGADRRRAGGDRDGN